MMVNCKQIQIKIKLNIIIIKKEKNKLKNMGDIKIREEILVAKPIPETNDDKTK